MARKKNITLDELAQMVADGFDATKADIERCATKADLEHLVAKVEILATKAEVHEGFDRVELHISSLGSDWRERFDALEMRVRKLEHKRS